MSAHSVDRTQLALRGHLPPLPTAAVKDGNWIQTVPGKGWFLVLRLYSPEEVFFTKAWRPGEVELVR